MISNGFADLADGNPQLAYNVIVDILAGINECVISAYSYSCNPQNLIPSYINCSNDNIRRHLSASTQLFPRGSLRSTIRMTDRGALITEEPALTDTEEDSGSDADSMSKNSAQQRGPIAEMLYSRWLEVRSCFAAVCCISYANLKSVHQGLRKATGLY